MKEKLLLNAKKGASPLIATVLIIAMVVAASAVVFIWGRGYQRDLMEKGGSIAGGKLSCATDIQMNILRESGGNLVIENTGRGRIDKFTLIADNDVPEEKNIMIEPGNTGEVPLPSQATIGSKVEIIPKIKIAKGFYEPCTSQKLTYKV